MTPQPENDSRQNGERNVEETAPRFTESVAASPSAKNNDQGVMPHATASATQVAENVAQGVKMAVGEALAWAEAKANKLSAKEEDGTGPYGSLATCAPSDFDAIATGVLPAMAPDRVRDGNPGGSEKDQEQEGPNGAKQEKVE